MKELLDRIASYNLFNYLLPGVVFVALAEQVTSYSFIQDDLVVGAFLYYFIGLVISRIGSLFVEPVLKKVAGVKFAPYPDFIKACQKDAKLEVLSEANNTYRTLCSLFLVLLLLKGYEWFALRCPLLESWSVPILLCLLLLLFILSYRKQTRYVVDRVKAALK